MKRIFTLSILVLFTLCFAGCDDSSSDPAAAPTTGTITVKATYTGAEPVAPSKGTTLVPGTKIIYVYVYSTLTNTNDSRGYIYKVQTDSAVTVGSEYELTIDNIAPGDYKVAAFYDYSTSSNLDNQLDRFIIYNNVATPNEATVVSVEAGSTDALTMTISDTNRLLSGSLFVTPVVK